MLPNLSTGKISHFKTTEENEGFFVVFQGKAIQQTNLRKFIGHLLLYRMYSFFEAKQNRVETPNVQ